MGIVKNKIAISKTNQFSTIVNDYVNQSDKLKPFIVNFPSVDAIAKQLMQKSEQKIDRNILVNSLKSQYANIDVSEHLKSNIDLMFSENTFTICTAHQPNIFTGYLYFIYKIIHAIKLAKECKINFPDKNFVPIYYIGSEDNDLEEIGTFNFLQQKMKWDTLQTGACGRMSTFDLIPLRDQIISTLHDEIPFEAEMIKALLIAYDGNHSLAQATRILVNILFGTYGLVVIDGDNHDLKKQFVSVMKDELLHQSSVGLVNENLKKFELHYKAQAAPRDLNLFYLKENLRERIERKGNVWVVVNTTIQFTEHELLSELEKYPERFSPNVILRPVYQETILPNVAFIGGGGELAYWLPLKPLFDYVGVLFPILFLRNSLLLIDKKSTKKIAKLDLKLEDLFLTVDELMKEEVMKENGMLQLEKHQQELNEVLLNIKALSISVAPSLAQSMEAHEAKIKRIQHRINQKFVANLKRDKKIRIEQLTNLRNQLFPKGSLQERNENFFSVIKHFDQNLIEILVEHQEGFGQEFIILQDM